MSELSIDIQVKKLQDWLISRRICNRQWHDQIIEVGAWAQRKTLFTYGERAKF